MGEKRRPPLGQFMYEKREALGLTVAEAGRRAGTSGAYWSQIEWGKTKLPGADLRRRIARALGVRHVDLLVSVGELTADECARDDSGRPEDEATDLLVRDLSSLMRDVQWNEEREGTIRGLLIHYRSRDQRSREDHQDATTSDPAEPTRGGQQTP